MNQHSQASKKSHGCLLLLLTQFLLGPRQEHRVVWRHPAQWGGEDRNVSQPQLNLHLRPSAEHLSAADHELFTTGFLDAFAAIAVVQIEGEK